MGIKNVMCSFGICATMIALSAVTVPCHAGDDPYGRNSRNLTEDQLNQGYDNVFKKVDVMKPEQGDKAQQDQAGAFGVDKGGDVGSDGNQRSDEQMSDQKSYTE